MKISNPFLPTLRNTTILVTIIAVTLLSSCTVKVRPARSHKHNTEQSIPPGQLKKITGSKSAAPYAPGQNK